MNEHRFDRFTRSLAGTTRRRVLRTLAGSAAGGIGVAALGRDAGAQQSFAARLQGLPTDEQAIALFEELGGIASDHTGNCDEWAAKAQDFGTSNADLIDQIKAAHDAWSRDQHVAFADTYGDRMQVAVAAIHSAVSRCSYVVDGSDSASPVAGTPVAGCGPSAAMGKAAPALQTCDCSSNCPLSWHACLVFGLECVSNGSCQCCWAGMCGSTSHCEDVCTANVCCNFPCSQGPN